MVPDELSKGYVVDGELARGNEEHREVENGPARRWRSLDDSEERRVPRVRQPSRLLDAAVTEGADTKVDLMEEAERDSRRGDERGGRMDVRSSD